MNKFSKMVIVGMVLSTSVQAQEDLVSVRVERDTLFGNGEPTRAEFVRGDLPYYLMWKEDGLKFTLSVPLVFSKPRNDNPRGVDWVPSRNGTTNNTNTFQVNMANHIVFLVDGLSKCLEGVQLDFLFEDNTKITFMNMNSFNCGGSWVQPINNDTTNNGALPSLMRGFYDKKFDYNRMAKRIKAIRFINLRSNTVSVHIPRDEMEKNYFIEIVNAYYSYTHDRP